MQCIGSMWYCISSQSLKWICTVLTYMCYVSGVWGSQAVLGNVKSSFWSNVFWWNGRKEWPHSYFGCAAWSFQGTTGVWLLLSFVFLLNILKILFYILYFMTIEVQNLKWLRQGQWHQHKIFASSDTLWSLAFLIKSLLVTAEWGCSSGNVFDLYSLSTGISDLAVLIGSRKTEHQVKQHWAREFFP